MFRSLLCTLLLFSSVGSFAQAPVSWTSSDMYLAIRKLDVLGSVLYVAAHPDDENTRLITYFSKEKMYKTGYLSMTRGDGGQNLIGEEQGIELGLIRTQELLSARRIDGGEQFFTRAYDFGYSKNPDETFTKWDKDKILSDVVWIIRKFQPDVIITRFPTTGEGGHGHHTASAILAVEAFNAAADPKRFPEQLQYVQTWQPRSVLWNSFNFGGGPAPANDTRFKMDVGAYNPLLGKSYGEIAAESRSQHKSQGFGVARGRGEALEYFTTLAGHTPTGDLFEGIETSWKRVPGGEKISNKIGEISKGFDLLNPHHSVKGLVELYQMMSALPNNQWKTQKMKEVQTLIEQCSGLWMDVFTQEQFAVQTDSIRFNFQFNNRLGTNATLKKITVDQFDSSMNVALTRNRNIGFQKTLLVPATKPLTQPYWLEEQMEVGYFNVKDQQKIGEPDVSPSYAVNITLEIEGQPFTYVRHAKYKYTDPVKGELYQPLVVVPPVTVKPETDVIIVTDKKEQVVTTVTVRAYRDYDFSAQKLISNTPGDNKIKVGSGSIRKNMQLEFPVTITDLGSKTKAQLYTSELTDRREKTKYEIKYDHIPNINYYTDAAIRFVPVDMKISGKKIGYIVGAGDKVPEMLEQMGYDVAILTNKELGRASLKEFDAIITGVRAYNTNEWMNNHYLKLMKYVEDGGNLIVQYNTSNQIGPVRARIGPFPFNITRTRVTDENSPVTFINPEHPVLNFPNKITQDDFKGWVQERSIYHAADSSNKFEKILSMNDPGEKSEDGSLLIVKHGKGYFTYTGLVFFRQLPAGVPGAYRLLANIIALNRKKAF